MLTKHGYWVTVVARSDAAAMVVAACLDLAANGEAELRAERSTGEAILEPMAAQLGLLDVATSVITQIGLNMVHEILTSGLSMVAIPKTNTQPRVAQGLEWLGYGDDTFNQSSWCPSCAG